MNIPPEPFHSSPEERELEFHINNYILFGGKVVDINNIIVLIKNAKTEFRLGEMLVNAKLNIESRRRSLEKETKEMMEIENNFYFIKEKLTEEFAEMLI